MYRTLNRAKSYVNRLMLVGHLAIKTPLLGLSDFVWDDVAARVVHNSATVNVTD